MWELFPSNACTSPRRRTISTAMTLFANQPAVEGKVPLVRIPNQSDDALQLKGFASKYAASTGYQDEKGE